MHYAEYIQKRFDCHCNIGRSIVASFYKKENGGHFGVVLYCFSFGEHILHCLLSISIFGTILVLLGGCFCCINLPKQAGSYVTAGCFGISFGIFGLTAYLPFLKKIFVYCCYCVLAMVWYTSRNIKKDEKRYVKYG